MQGILALTFTEKAAAEMRERVRKALMEQGKAKEDLLEDLHWASISTFHSFCARVLREFPLESEVDPDFQVLDEVQADLLVDDAFDALVYKSTGGPTEEALVSLLTLAGTWRLRAYLLALYAKRGAAERAFAKLEGTDGAKAWWYAMQRRAPFPPGPGHEAGPGTDEGPERPERPDPSDIPVMATRA